jgi:hypothetical protein
MCWPDFVLGFGVGTTLWFLGALWFVMTLPR